MGEEQQGKSQLETVLGLPQRQGKGICFTLRVVKPYCMG